MDETGLDYPDEDDLDRMLDDELEVELFDHKWKQRNRREKEK